MSSLEALSALKQTEVSLPFSPDSALSSKQCFSSRFVSSPLASPPFHQIISFLVANTRPSTTSEHSSLKFDVAPSSHLVVHWHHSSIICTDSSPNRRLILPPSNPIIHRIRHVSDISGPILHVPLRPQQAGRQLPQDLVIVR
jgi:hypothetical protein